MKNTLKLFPNISILVDAKMHISLKKITEKKIVISFSIVVHAIQLRFPQGVLNLKQNKKDKWKHIKCKMTQYPGEQHG
jgi:hypothetical protein